MADFTLPSDDRKALSRLFGGIYDGCVLACIDGKMGKYALSESGDAARITSGDFCIFAGKPNAELVKGADAYIVTAYSPEWYVYIEGIWQEKAKRGSRYSINKVERFDTEKLKNYVSSLNSEYTLSPITAELYPTLMSEGWSSDFCSLFDGREDFLERGLGIVALYNGKPVSGAASYVVFNGGIEIEIDTKEEFAGRGLATACGAKLILECLSRGLYPNWDAHDLRSVHLAGKLGYTMKEEYTVYFLDI